MKLFFRVFVFVAFVSGLRAQNAFHIGALVLDMNTGVEVYNSTNVYTLMRDGRTSDTTVSDQTGNSNFSLGLEVGLNRFIGLGLRGRASSFFRSLDAVSNARADVHATDLLLQVNLHPITLKRFDLVIGGEIGLSKLKMDFNDMAQTLITGQGAAFGLYLNPRFYMKRLGFNFRAAMPLFNYKTLQHSTSDPANYLLSQWKANGLGLSLGVQYRFF